MAHLICCWLFGSKKAEEAKGGEGGSKKKEMLENPSDLSSNTLPAQIKRYAPPNQRSLCFTLYFIIHISFFSYLQTHTHAGIVVSIGANLEVTFDWFFLENKTKRLL